MQLERKKPRLPRVERNEGGEIDTEENLLWAVSYSDLLMVLMSFFVIYFAANKDKKDAIFQEVNVALNENIEGSDVIGRGSGASSEEGGDKEGAGTEVGTNKGKGDAAKDGLGKGNKEGEFAAIMTEEEYAEYKRLAKEQIKVEAKIKKSISTGLTSLGINLEISDNPLSMVVNFPDNLYGKAQFELSDKGKILINEIFLALNF